jgi:2-hydroxy-3-keto-5-methylthiopentenyl-1-phosphate phosphatase
LLEDLKDLVKKSKVGEIEFYIVSGGLQEIVEASLKSAKLRRYFSGIYACELSADENQGYVKHIKRCVTFTEKTRYLFEINKGINPNQGRRNPYLVNKDVPISNRRIPFKNMIYRFWRV